MCVKLSKSNVSLKYALPVTWTYNHNNNNNNDNNNIIIIIIALKGAIRDFLHNNNNDNNNNIIIIIAFKGAIRDFLQSPHSAANCFQHVRSSGPGAIVCKSRATHRALITCIMSCDVRATWYERTAQLLSLTEL